MTRMTQLRHFSNSLFEGVLKSILQERFNEWCDKSRLRRLSRTDWPRACQAYGPKGKEEIG